MTHRFVFAIAAALMLSGLATADEKPGAAANKVPRAADGHPVLNGTWAYTIDLPPVVLKKQVNGSVATKTIDTSWRESEKTAVPGARPSTAAPSYKPEFREKVKYLFDNESKLDQVFYCGKPGVPRIGSPRRIIQLPGEMVFLYEDICLPLRGHIGRPVPNYSHRRPRAPRRCEPVVLRRLRGPLGGRYSGGGCNQFSEGWLVWRRRLFPHRCHARDRTVVAGRRKSGLASHGGRSKGPHRAVDDEPSRGEAL